MTARAFAVLIFLASSMAVAQDAEVRASLRDTEQVWVGQRVTVIVELLVPGYFASAASFDIPDPQGVLLMPPQGHPIVSSETIDGTMYSVQRHEFLAWPMRSGEQSVPPVTARFDFKRNPLDTNAVRASVTTPAMPFTVAMPPGAEQLGTVISARDLEVQEIWDPEPGDDSIEAGTAFTRTITFTAPDVPGMVFPPFPAGEIEGLGVHSEQSLQDRENRGALTGMRRDTITYICKRPGRFTIPGAKLTWFDLDSRELRTEEFAARTLNVVVNPAMAAAVDGPATDPRPGHDRAWWAGAAAVLVLLAVLATSRGVRREIARLSAPLLPVHLQSLNPEPRSGDAGGFSRRSRISTRSRLAYASATDVQPPAQQEQKGHENDA